MGKPSLHRYKYLNPLADSWQFLSDAKPLPMIPTTVNTNAISALILSIVASIARFTKPNWGGIDKPQSLIWGKFKIDN
ncbi:hypothetical protein HYR99_19245 [Candidatus Poribacteria bacterium]|nr:hypothetical protein [Candidatus Poribacteria bacterium]